MATKAELAPARELAQHDRRFPNESDGYRKARRELLAEEIELRRHIERVAAQRRALPPGGEVRDDHRFVGEAGPAASPSCSATSRRSSPTTGCSGRGASGPARCAPRS
jgi:hypothetical protein